MIKSKNKYKKYMKNIIFSGINISILLKGAGHNQIYTNQVKLVSGHIHDDPDTIISTSVLSSETPSNTRKTPQCPIKNTHKRTVLRGGVFV